MPKKHPRRLSRAASKALGTVSPELFKLRLEDCLAGLIEEYSIGSEELVKFAQWGESLDLTDVLVEVGNTNPIDLANWMASANPNLPLSNPRDLPVLEPLKAALRMLVGCDPFRPKIHQ